MPFLGIKFPWETEHGEGFMAPWTPSAQTSTGTYYNPANYQTGQNLYDPSLGIEAPWNVASLGGGQTLPGAVNQAAQNLWPGSVGAFTTQGGFDASLVPQSGENLVDKVINIGTGGAAQGAQQAGVDWTKIILGILGGMGVVGTGVAAARMKWPWQTPEGEGFIAPWQNQVDLGGGIYGVEGVQYPGYPQTYQNGGSALPSVGQAMPGLFVTKAWTNAAKNGSSPATVAFFKLSNGTIITRALDGSMKKYRPKKHIVISSNPRLKSLNKLDKVYKRTQKTVRKFAPKKTVPLLTSKYLSPVEKKAVRARG